MMTQEEAREEKIRRYKLDPDYYESIFKQSNTMCEGGCEGFLTFQEEEAGWGMCMNCKFDAMK